MDREYVIEKAKLDTEKLKLFFAVFLACAIGIFSIMSKDTFGDNEWDKNLVYSGISFDTLMLIILLKAYRKIKILLKFLNKK